MKMDESQYFNKLLIVAYLVLDSVINVLQRFWAKF